MLISSSFSGWVVNTWLPHSPQKALIQPPAPGSQRRTIGSPLVMRKEPGTVNALTENADPVRRWHRLQWQYSAPTSGSVTSKRTPSHMQPPVRDMSAARYYSVRRSRISALDNPSYDDHERRSRSHAEKPTEGSADALPSVVLAPPRLPEGDIDEVGLAVVEPDPDPVVVVLRKAGRAPVVDVLRAVPAIGARAVGRGGVDRLVEARRRRPALRGRLPHRRRVALDHAAVGALELELHGDGASALEDARAHVDLVSGVVDRLQEPIEPVDDPVAARNGRRVAGLVGCGGLVAEGADAVGEAAADGDGTAAADSGEPVTGAAGGRRDGAQRVDPAVLDAIDVDGRWVGVDVDAADRRAARVPGVVDGRPGHRLVRAVGAQRDVVGADRDVGERIDAGEVDLHRSGVPAARVRARC